MPEIATSALSRAITIALRYSLSAHCSFGIFREQGFGLGRQTAHGLMAKASALLERMREAIRRADRVINIMRKAGIHVSTDWQEGQQVLDELAFR